MVDKERAYDGTQCKAFVTPEDGSKKYRCRLGIWKKHPKDGYCFMHHPNVELRGGAATVAIDKGELEPKTDKARARLKLKKKGKTKRMGRPPKQPAVDRTVDKSSPYQVAFLEHKIVDEDGELRAEGTVAFFSEELAKGFAKVLSETSPRHPLLNQHSLYFYSNVRISKSKT